MQTIILYTKNDCHLCSDVKNHLSTLRHAYPHKLVEIDITQDADTFALYRFSIPVIEIGDTTLRAPITTAQLERALASVD